MSGSNWCSLQGVPALVASLQRRMDGYEDRLEEAATAGAMIVEEEAKSRVRKKSGELAESIDHRTVEKGAGRCFVAVGPKAFHGYFGELGTKKMAAWPYLRPALIENKDRIVEAIKEKFKGG
jgi:HK97 gp10 family phage protein